MAFQIWNPEWFPLPGQAVFVRDHQQIAAVSRDPNQLDLSQPTRPIRHRLRQQSLDHLLEPQRPGESMQALRF
jgi:hypothetical protein